MKLRLRFSLLLPLAAIALAAAAHADNLVVNGSFEGSTTYDPDTFGYLPASWTYTPAPDSFGSLSVGGDTTDPNNNNFFVPAEDGSEFVAFGAFSAPDILSQQLATTVGSTYDFSFYVDTELAFGPNFSASWDGANLLDVTTALPAGWNEYNLVATATGSDTISFQGADPSGYTLLDNVSVTLVGGAASVPDQGPGLFLTSLSLCGLVIAARYRPKLLS